MSGLIDTGDINATLQGLRECRFPAFLAARLLQ